MVDDIVDLFGLELILYRYRHCPVCQGCEKRHRPMGGVSSAKGNLIALFHSGLFKKDVELFYLSRHVVILKCDAFVICKGVLVPVVDNTLFNVFIETAECFHCTIV